MIWFKENIASIITLMFVLVLIYLCIYSLYKQRKQGTCSCGKSCSSCLCCCINKNQKLKRS